MDDRKFQALVVEEAAGGVFIRTVKERYVSDLPVGEVLIRVEYSSLNYKDALSASGNRGVTKNYPHTPGIDAAGVVVESAVEEVRPGDSVIVTSYDLGMNTPGGFGRYIRVPASWVVPLPSGLTLKESMVLGTAGFTAGLSVSKVDEVISPDEGPVLVTGATGGVGSVAVAILAKLGYEVIAVSGKADAEAYLKGLGAKEVVDRERLTDQKARPLLKDCWAGVVDTVGGDMLTAAIKSTHPHGIVTCCGNVASAELSLTVYPFILRGITLAGIDSQGCPMDLRRRVWTKLAHAWKLEKLESLAQVSALEDLSGHIEAMLQGRIKGRILVDLTAL
ncbi:quinone oxidoreductase [Syntrophotalea acetylenivorans]|uniref:Quinone oxidoreductase n=1 Tax=Syntrophotalea acetylenivorans TaxID=1842532 RepID=A0A1L3GKT9_9BACT|nr:YhdH/YhfP family quinone oxidoreductase [Syntrophotalea acetylenivorans]APG26557.1 quinone oxidoreductase [Syntrophotalea acetylenivorans]